MNSVVLCFNNLFLNRIFLTV